MFITSVLTVFLLSVPDCSWGKSEPDWCSMCPKPGTHTMCLFPREGPSAKCTKYVRRKMDAQTKRTLVFAQNALRNRVALGLVDSESGLQPPADAMMQLEWHDGLQRIAQRWADQCTPFQLSRQHDACKDTEDFDAGQNIVTVASLRTKPVDYQEAVQDWYKEVADYDPEWLQAYMGSVRPPKKIGHYTQLVWAKSRYVGCGAATFVDVIGRKKWWVNRVVCNYGPAGNVIGAQVYKVGRPCSRCPRDTRCSPHFPGLCATEEQISNPPHLPVEDKKPAEWVVKEFGVQDPQPAKEPKSFLLETVGFNSTTVTTTVPTTVPTTVQTTVPTTVQTTVPTTVPTTVATTVPTTVQTTVTENPTEKSKKTTIDTELIDSKVAHKQSPKAEPETTCFTVTTPATSKASTSSAASIKSSSFSLSPAERILFLGQRGKGRRRWRTPVCLCPVDDGDDDEDEGQSGRSGRRENEVLRSKASVHPGPVAVLIVVILKALW